MRQGLSCGVGLVPVVFLFWGLPSSPAPGKGMFGQDEGGSAQGSPASGAMRQGGLEASRRRMQEEMDARAAQYRMKQQELEDQRRRQKIDRTLKMPVALRH